MRSTIGMSRPKGAPWARRTGTSIEVVKELKKHQADTGVGLLWGTACLFAHPRYMHGAATSCNADVFAHAAAQVKKAIEVTHELDGAGYVFWGDARATRRS